MAINVNHVTIQELIQHLTVAAAAQVRAAKVAEMKYGPLVVNEMNERTNRLNAAIAELRTANVVIPIKKS